MRNYVVYVHKNKTNGKRYFGITNNVPKRWYGNGKKYEPCRRFWAAIQKYGWDGFTHEIIETGLLLEEANEREQFYISKYRTCEREHGYNIQPGGNFTPTMEGKHHSEGTKRKISESAKGRIISEEQRKTQSSKMMGRLAGEKNGRSRAVICVNTGEVFESQRIAAQEKGVLQSKISRCCAGKLNHVHGMKWEYADKSEE